MQFKKLFLIIITTMTVAVSSALVMYLSLSNYIMTTIKFNARVKFITESIIERLEANDPTLYDDLKAMNAEYQVSEEKQPLEPFIKKYFPEQYPKYYEKVPWDK